MLETAAFDALEVDPEALARTAPDKSALDVLRAAHSEATARIGTAFASYGARVCALTTPS